MPTIKKATKWFSSYKTGSMDPSVRVEDINRVLGFESQVGDPAKVEHEWLFTVDGKEAGIWDYYGVRWSVYDPHNVLHRVFPGMVD